MSLTPSNLFLAASTCMMFGALVGLLWLIAGF